MSVDPAQRVASVLAQAPTSIDVPGLGERPLASPTSLEEFSDVVRLAAEERWALLPLGFGSKLGWCPPAQRVDLVLGTRGYTGVTSYEPGDGTLTARAGTPMAELSATVAAGGHHLSPDVARPEAASLGGVLAAGASGADRLFYGPARHNLLGTLVCQADGQRTRSGGQLVKNVTGYDLHRLHCGAHGTLGVVLEASLRLHPLPVAAAALTRTFATSDEALLASRTVLDQPVRPRSVSAVRRAKHWRLAVVLGGREDVVAAETRRLHEALESLEVTHGEAAHELQRELRDLEHDDGAPCLRLAGTPSRLGTLLTRLGRATELPARTVLHPGLATATLVFPSSPPVDEILRALGDSRAEVRWHNLEAAPAAPSPAGLGLMQGLKRSLDPAGLFGPGRIHGI